MGLVDYSESESEPEEPAKGFSSQKAAPTKKPFQKVVDRSNPGKIVVNLPPATSGTNGTDLSDEPPAKRARTEKASGGAFSGFNSFLPPPKNANKPAATSSSSSAKPKPGVNLKTSAAPGFSRDGADHEGLHAEEPSGGMSLPPPKKQAEPLIPEGQKSAEDVKLVGKPMMFRPLSVSRNTNKKTSRTGPSKPASAPSDTTPAAKNQADGTQATELTAQPPPPKKFSLFSMHTEESPAPSSSSAHGGAYEPLFATQGPTAGPESAAQNSYAQPASAAGAEAESLDNIASDLNLSAAQRRELFGREGRGAQMAKKVINFNMDKEYQHNEAVRASGETQMHNPVRAIQSGKNSLKQLVQNAQNQREALEDSFARGKNNRKEAASRYGW